MTEPDRPPPDLRLPRLSRLGAAVVVAVCVVAVATTAALALGTDLLASDARPSTEAGAVSPAGASPSSSPESPTESPGVVVQPGTVIEPSSGTLPGEGRRREQIGRRTLAAHVQELLTGNFGATVFRVSSLNVLGASHTRPGGNKGTRPSGATRMRGVVELLERQQVDVVGFQEYEPRQHLAFTNLVGDAWQVFPGPTAARGAVRQSIAWRADTWEALRTETIAVPYFRGNLIPMPYVLLANKATGQKVWFANFHNPATTGQFGRNEVWRDRATEIEIDLVNRLLREGSAPVIVTGDMNERDEYFCKMTAAAPMVAANGGSNRGGVCDPPRPEVIDWIFASSPVSFSDYVRDVSPLVRRTTDHPMFAATVLVP